MKVAASSDRHVVTGLDKNFIAYLLRKWGIFWKILYNSVQESEVDQSLTALLDIEAFGSASASAFKATSPPGGTDRKSVV